MNYVLMACKLSCFYDTLLCGLFKPQWHIIQLPHRSHTVTMEMCYNHIDMCYNYTYMYTDREFNSSELISVVYE